MGKFFINNLYSFEPSSKDLLNQTDNRDVDTILRRKGGLDLPISGITKLNRALSESNQGIFLTHIFLFTLKAHSNSFLQKPIITSVINKVLWKEIFDFVK